MLLWPNAHAAKSGIWVRFTTLCASRTQAPFCGAFSRGYDSRCLEECLCAIYIQWYIEVN